MSFQVPDSTLIEDEYNYDYDDIWDEYPDEDEAVIVPTSDIKRINFAKYGKKISNESVINDDKTSNTKDVLNSLPDAIYCDLVTTLDAKCIQEWSIIANL